MGKIIIGIHGLGNKPSSKILKKWWKNSINEGLERIGHKRIFLPFELIYWSDLLYEKPLNPKEKDSESQLYLDEPYAPNKNYLVKTPSNLRKKVLDYIEKQLDKIFLNEDMSLNYSFVTDMIIKHFFKDLDKYYSINETGYLISQSSVKNRINNRILELLDKYKAREILLISHSMGSIIAFDLLLHEAENIQIDTFVTMGSPLGLPAIMSKFATKQKEMTNKIHKITTPENIFRNWYNFSDLEDKIAFNYNLGDDYQGNTHNVKATDIIVYNDYVNNKERNPHKSYGYLRTPELAEVINEFLNRGKSEIYLRWAQFVNRLFMSNSLFKGRFK